MCTLAVYFRVAAEYPLVVAANRDEFYDRPTAAPALLSGERGGAWVFGGRDLVAGGTWLGVNAHGLVAALLNRRTGRSPDPKLRSRGLLCLRALECTNAAGAAKRIGEENGGDYNPFHLLLASPTAAFTVGNPAGGMRVGAIEPGVHILTNSEPNDPSCPRIAKSQPQFLAAAELLRASDLGGFLDRVRVVLSDHSAPVEIGAALPPENLCVHTPVYGTRSSTVLAYSAAARRYLAWHAEGPPCTTPYSGLVLPRARARRR